MINKLVCFLKVLFHIVCSFVAFEACGEERIVLSSSWVGAGFFAEFNNTVEALVYNWDGNHPERLAVDWTQEFYPFKDDPHSNGWDLFFEFTGSNAPYRQIPRPIHSNRFCVNRWIRYQEHRPWRMWIHNKIQEHIKIKQPILDQADQFYNETMAGHYCIGVHVRLATAKKNENPYQWSIQEYIDETKRLMHHHRKRNPIIFLATDSERVIRTFKKKFKDKLFYIPAHRAVNAEDPHLIYEHADYYLSHPEEFHHRKPGYYGGLTTLLDCLLLSKCHVMVHSISNIPECAAYFNPSIESIFIPKTVSASACTCDQWLSSLGI